VEIKIRGLPYANLPDHRQTRFPRQGVFKEQNQARQKSLCVFLGASIGSTNNKKKQQAGITRIKDKL